MSTSIELPTYDPVAALEQEIQDVSAELSGRAKVVSGWPSAIDRMRYYQDRVAHMAELRVAARGTGGVWGGAVADMSTWFVLELQGRCLYWAEVHAKATGNTAVLEIIASMRQDIAVLKARTR